MRRRSFSSLIALAAMGSATAATEAAADTCDPSRLMVILDQSSSMVSGSIGGMTKWDIAVNAVTSVATSFDDKLQMGLMKFPSPNQCAPGTLFVEPALNNSAVITSELATAPPASGNYTPMYQTLDAAGDEPSLQQTDVPNYVVLVTDGWQWCDPYDATERFKSVDSVIALRNMGITTYVVGFGSSVDTLALNKMAAQAGTALPGCNPDSTDAGASDNCYFQADNLGDLNNALTQIASNATAEICDGLDNDCDGVIDNGLNRACSTDCGSGSETCVMGQWEGCDAPQPEEEICDGEDNDCDGTADPGCDCIPGDARDCGTDVNVGECATGTQTCGNDGLWGECEGEVRPESETCDGRDNDCDGEVDEASAGIAEVESFADLCDTGFMCIDGGCEPVEPVPPPDETPETDELPALDDGMATGCACRTSNGSVPWSTATMMLMVLGMVVRRRRRS